MDSWFKFSPVSAVHKRILGRKRNPVSQLSKFLDYNANKKTLLKPIDQIDHCHKHECFLKIAAQSLAGTGLVITAGCLQKILSENIGSR